MFSSRFPRQKLRILRRMQPKKSKRNLFLLDQDKINFSKFIFFSFWNVSKHFFDSWPQFWTSLFYSGRQFWAFCWDGLVWHLYRQSWHFMTHWWWLTIALTLTQINRIRAHNKQATKIVKSFMRSSRKYLQLGHKYETLESRKIENLDRESRHQRMTSPRENKL